jgi:hypothetical protein
MYNLFKLSRWIYRQFEEFEFPLLELMFVKLQYINKKKLFDSFKRILLNDLPAGSKSQLFGVIVAAEKNKITKSSITSTYILQNTRKNYTIDRYNYCKIIAINL